MDRLPVSLNGSGVVRQVTLSHEHAAFLDALCPDTDAALNEVLALYLSVCRCAKALEPQNGTLFGSDPPKARKAATGPAADLVAWFVRAWEHWRDGGIYSPNGKDFIAAGKLLRDYDVREIRRRANNMLSQEEKWWVQNSSLMILLSKWNALEQE